MLVVLVNIDKSTWAPHLPRVQHIAWFDYNAKFFSHNGHCYFDISHDGHI